MAAQFPPPLTDVTNPDSLLGWLRKVRDWLNEQFRVFTGLDFTGSNLTSIITRNHNDLQNIQGGAAADYYHLTSAQRTALLTLEGITGISAVITTAPITALGSTGTMTFTNGILTASTPAT